MIVKNQRISKCLICDDTHETIKHIISECSKEAQTSIIHYTICCGRLSTGNCTRNLNLNNPEFVLKNDLVI